MRGRDRLADGVMKAQEQRSEFHEDTSDGHLQSTGAARIVVVAKKS